MKNNRCSYCLKHGEGQLTENTGWYHSCTLGKENDGLQNIEECEGYYPNRGFQIGGYYTPIHFEVASGYGEVNSCMEMVIHSNGEFPREDPEEQIVFHICDFKQIEKFVKVWGDYFRKTGVIKDEE